jgi:hypothetical protein
MHALGDDASLVDKLLGERQVVLTLSKERLSINGELIPSGLNWLRRLCSCPWQSWVVARAKTPALGIRDTFSRAGGMHLPKRPDHLALDVREAKSVLANISFVGEIVPTKCFAISSKLVRERLAPGLLGRRKAIKPVLHGTAAPRSAPKQHSITSGTLRTLAKNVSTCA